MDFWTFLNWLWSVITRVTDWFGSQYEALRNGAANAWNWAVAQAGQAYQAAVNWATDHINQLSATVNSVISFVDQLQSDVTGWITAAVKTAEDWAAGLVNGAITQLTSTISTAVQGAEDWAANVINNTAGSLANYIDAKVKDVTNLYSPLLVLRAVLGILQDLTSQNTYTRIKSLVGANFTLLGAFLSDPVGFLVGVIWPITVDLVSYAIAYAMGSVNTPLPPLPSWSELYRKATGK